MDWSMVDVILILHQRRRHLQEWHEGFHDYWYDKPFNVDNFLKESW